MSFSMDIFCPRDGLKFCFPGNFYLIFCILRLWLALLFFLISFGEKHQIQVRELQAQSLEEVEFCFSFFHFSKSCWSRETLKMKTLKKWQKNILLGEKVGQGRGQTGAWDFHVKFIDHLPGWGRSSQGKSKTPLFMGSNKVLRTPEHSLSTLFNSCLPCLVSLGQPSP